MNETIIAPHGVDRASEHYHKVLDSMKRLGAPTIRVVDLGDGYQAIEGSHRLAAAKELGLIVFIVKVNGKRVRHDFQGLPARCRAEVIVDYVARDLDRPSYSVQAHSLGLEA